MPGNIQPTLPAYSPPCVCPYGECSCIPFTLPPQPSCIRDVVGCSPIYVWPGVPIPILPTCQDLLLPVCPLPLNPLVPRPPFDPFPPPSAVPIFTYNEGCPITGAFPFPTDFPPPTPTCVFDDPPCCPLPPLAPPAGPPLTDLPLLPPFTPLLPPLPNINPPSCNIGT